MAVILPRVMPLLKIIALHRPPGTTSNRFGVTVTSMARPTEVATITTLR